MSIDKSLICRDCGTAFVFTRGEQEFYARRGFINEPSRCHECRRTRGRSHDSGLSGGHAHGEPERQEQQLFAAVCAQCGKGTQVAAHLLFGDAPISCSECSANQRESAYASTGGWRDSW